MENRLSTELRKENEGTTGLMRQVNKQKFASWVFQKEEKAQEGCSMEHQLKLTRSWEKCELLDL